MIHYLRWKIRVWVPRQIKSPCQKADPPEVVMPYRLLSVTSIRLSCGLAPSLLPPAKECSSVMVPAEVMEDRSEVVGSAERHGAIEVAVCGLEQARDRLRAVHAVERVEAVEGTGSLPCSA